MSVYLVVFYRDRDREGSRERGSERKRERRSKVLSMGTDRDVEAPSLSTGREDYCFFSSS